jgi:hypothetical protein
VTDRRTVGTEEVAASSLGRLLHEGGKSTAARDSDPELDRLLRMIHASPNAPAPRRNWAPWAFAAAVLVGVVAFEWRRHDGSALTFEADGVAENTHAAIAADAGRVVDLHFSDGSAFDMQPGALVRVESSSSSGARVSLLEGKTVAHVVHRAKSSWSVTAGPFEVQITGTRFGASWDAAKRRLSVELYEGSVQVVGGSFVAPIAVRAGQRLEAGTGSGNWLLTSLDGPNGASATPPRSAGTTPATAPPTASSSDETGDAGVGQNDLAPHSATTRAFEWTQMLERADFEGIVREANDYGIDRCLATCTAKDLRTLADSARYLGRFPLAERTLLALRSRSPVEAATAAFLLGRLEESRDPAQALSWYERHLREAPNGTYAAEAWAGKMRMLFQIGGPAAARPAAEQYLKRFPNGVRAAAAREILSNAPSP